MSRSRFGPDQIFCTERYRLHNQICSGPWSDKDLVRTKLVLQMGPITPLTLDTMGTRVLFLNTVSSQCTHGKTSNLKSRGLHILKFFYHLNILGWTSGFRAIDIY